MPAVTLDAETQRRLSIGFINLAHGLDHYVMLIFPTVVIGLEAIYGRPYAELIALGTASFFAFGIFSLPAGWIADHWSRRNIMAVFFIGCSASLLAAALAPNLIVLAIALFALGVFAAIYHPVGTAMVVAAAINRGRTLAFNGVCGNLGVAFAAGITAALTTWLGWRGAFLVPAALCLVTGIAYLMLIPDDRHETASRSTTAEVRIPLRLMLAVLALFLVIFVTYGLVFNVITIALPKVIDDRLQNSISLTAVGGIATVVFLFGAAAQLAIGRIIEKYPPHLVFAVVGVLQFAGVVWVAYATGQAVLAALAFAMAFIYAQVTINDFLLARYIADAWRGRVYAVRYFITYVISGAAASMIAFFYSRGGFDQVLAATALVAVAFVIGSLLVTVLVSGVERRSVAQPAE
jgi:MFS family permease